MENRFRGIIENGLSILFEKLGIFILPKKKKGIFVMREI